MTDFEPSICVTSCEGDPEGGDLRIGLGLRDRDATRQLAAILAELVAEEAVGIGLSGELGAGKTELVRQLVAALGGRSEDVASPSYVLEYDYPIPPRGGARILHVSHWDLYRLSSGVLPGELAEQLSDPAVLTVVEWPERVSEAANLLPLRVMLAFEGLSETDTDVLSPASPVFPGERSLERREARIVLHASSVSSTFRARLDAVRSNLPRRERC